MAVCFSFLRLLILAGLIAGQGPKFNPLNFCIMITIKNTTKRGAAFVDSYNRATNRRLSDCYGKYSTEKSRAEYFCMQRMSDESGDGFKIISFNTFGFSCAWRTAAGLRVETPTNSYLIA